MIAMQWTSILAIYFLFWVMCAFIVMPMGVRNAHELGTELLPGQEPGAPVNFNPRRIVLRTTLVSAILFGFYYANYVNRWLTLEMIGIHR
jgi:predicted secreted protein